MKKDDSPLARLQQPETKTVTRLSVLYVSGAREVYTVEEDDIFEEMDGGYLITRRGTGDTEIISKAAIAHLKRQTLVVKLPTPK